MSAQTFELISNGTLSVSDRELSIEIVDNICELISGFVPDKNDPGNYRNFYNIYIRYLHL